MSGSAESTRPSNITEARQPARKRARVSNHSSRNSTPNAYARRSPPRERAPRPISDDEDEESRSPPRKLKRPGAGARIGLADRAAAEAARKRREEEQRSAVNERQTGGVELVASHYNAVPERGREWRKTDSQIKGLRSLNNWIKSTLIQKFSRPDIPVQQLCVLDMACGKGGDLGKWEKAPQVPALYVGCDIAAVSVDQAKQRWEETLRRSRGRNRRPLDMHAEFYVHDAFGKPLSDVPRVREVGFNPHAGPGSGVIQGGMMTGGFDVVSMMFALHYSYESEPLARGMLKNVAGALKKGGRFFGVMPNSDIISASVKRLLQAESTGQTPNERAKPLKDGQEEGEVEEDDEWDPEKPAEPNDATIRPSDDGEDDWDPEKPSEPAASTTNGVGPDADDGEDDWDPENPSEAAATLQHTDANTSPQQNGTTSSGTASKTDLPPLEWGNRIYTVRFPRNQPLANNLPLPKDGIFRPPYGWRYHYQLEEAVDVPEFVVPWEGFRALAEEYGLELMYKKGFREVFEDESGDRELGMLAERMGVMSRDRSEGRGGLLVGEEEMEASSLYLAFCFYKT